MALVVFGMAACVYFALTDQNDPDYAPPIFVISSIAGAWLAIVGMTLLLFLSVSRLLGTTSCLWLGLGIAAFGILKLLAFEFEPLELWRISRVSTIRFDLVAVTALILGGALTLKSGAFRRPQAEAKR